MKTPYKYQVNFEKVFINGTLKGKRHHDFLRFTCHNDAKHFDCQTEARNVQKWGF